jgi:IS5 family transposase
VDSKTKLIHAVVATAANVHDKHPLPTLLHGAERRVYGDAQYAGQGGLIKARAPQAHDFTQYRGRGYRYLTA